MTTDLSDETDIYACICRTEKTFKNIQTHPMTNFVHQREHLTNVRGTSTDLTWSLNINPTAKKASTFCGDWREPVCHLPILTIFCAVTVESTLANCITPRHWRSTQILSRPEGSLPHRLFALLLSGRSFHSIRTRSAKFCIASFPKLSDLLNTVLPSTTKDTSTPPTFFTHSSPGLHLSASAMDVSWLSCTDALYQTIISTVPQIYTM